MKKFLLMGIVLLLSVFLVACGDDEDAASEVETIPGTPEEQELDEVEVTEEEEVDPESVVVQVNDAEIKGSKYNNIYMQLKTLYHMYGQGTDDFDLIKDETIAILTEQELISQDAEEKGIEVTDEEAQAEIDAIVEENGEEALTALLEQYDLNEEEFLEQLKVDIMTMEYIQSEFDIEVTDEEIEEQYNQMTEGNEEAGELEEYEDRIRQSITEQKQREMLEERVEELKDNADIETLI